MTVTTILDYKRQELADTFYWRNGPCCAGCDWWANINSVCGNCTRYAPVSGHERTAMLGMKFNSAPPGAGHILTNREYRCGEFKDSFDWPTLPSEYLARIGYKGGKA